jgi:hypothetical protein
MPEHVREWYAQIAEASKTPGLAQHLVRRTGELFPRFSSYYERLRALPRRLRRALGRKLSLAGIAMLLALCGGTIQARTFFVNEICTLPNAIIAANTDFGTFGCPNGAGDDVIILKSDVTLDAPLPAITKTLTIKAGTHSIVDGAGLYPCFEVRASVVLDGLTIRNCSNPGQAGAGVNNYFGDLTIKNCTISGNTAYHGGGISNGGDLTIDHSTISGNTAEWEGGGISGGGDSLTIVDSVISGNTAAIWGGGISSGGYGSFKVLRTEVSGNNSGFHGGGIFVYTYSRPTVEITDSLISGNSTGIRGGGIASLAGFTGGAYLSIRGTTISGNTADEGGGVASDSSEDNNNVRIEQSTISGNTATSAGGGVFQTAGFCSRPQDTLSLVNATVSNNTSGEEGGGVFIECADLAMSHSLIVGNGAPTGAELSIRRPTKVLESEYNVVGYNGKDRSHNFSPGPTDIIPDAGVLVEDILAPLADNGGPTPTHALVPGSPAIDAIPTTDPNCVGTKDQRGVARPVGPGCDVGAVEVDHSTQ